jgi:competence protein ComEC
MRENARARWAAPLGGVWLPRARLAAEQGLAGWIEAERGRFLPWLAVFMGAGIVLFFARAAEPPPWIGLALVGLALPLVGLCWGRRVPRAATACGLALALGFASASLRTRAMPPMAVLPRDAMAVLGTVVAVQPLPVGRRVILGQVTLGGGAVMARGLRLRLRNTDLQPLAPG